MQEIARVTLYNEMDLVLAHKRSMKLAELTGLSLSAQTTFATAVSEVSRTTIENGKNGCLVLGISNEPKKERFIVASIKDESGKGGKRNTGLEYAKKLVNKFNVSQNESSTIIELYYSLPDHTKLGDAKIEGWKELFVDEPAVSPYEEIKRKNDQLRELSHRLQESENQYKTLTNSLPLIIFSFDMTGKLTFANDWFFQYTELNQEELTLPDWKGVIHEEDQDAFALLVNQKVRAGSSSIKTQCRFRNAATGEYLWHLISISPLKDENNTIYQWIGYGVDINAQKVYETTLKDNKELQEIKGQLEHNVHELNRSNQELQQFAFIASHDLQEPVRKVAYYSDLLMHKYTNVVDKKGQQYLQGLFRASSRMRFLINDILSFSQVNKTALRIEEVDLNEVVQQVVADFELSINEKKASVHIETLPSLEGDRALMMQVFGNLISNSLKYIKKDVPPHIMVRSQLEDSQVIISIEDNGVGFDEKYKANMFKLFQRLHSKDQYEGTGLGLAICQKIVELHNGTITAFGRPDKGAIFTIQLLLKYNYPGKK